MDKLFEYAIANLGGIGLLILALVLGALAFFDRRNKTISDNVDTIGSLLDQVQQLSADLEAERKARRELEVKLDEFGDMPARMKSIEHEIYKLGEALHKKTTIIRRLVEHIRLLVSLLSKHAPDVIVPDMPEVE